MQKHHRKILINPCVDCNGTPLNKKSHVIPDATTTMLADTFVIKQRYISKFYYAELFL